MPRQQLESDLIASQSWDDIIYDASERRGRIRQKVALAIFLCAAGVALLTSGLVLWYHGAQGGRTIALITLGSITFLPGFYHVRIAYLAWKGVQGYSLNDIPEY